MTIYGYARRSSEGKSVEEQANELRAAGAEVVFSENKNKAGVDRPELRKVLGKLGPGDTLLLTRLDRMARSLRDLLNIVEEIKEAGAGFRSLSGSDMSADPNTPAGRLVMGVLGSMAEFERSLIEDRTSRGRKAAMAAGVQFGRKPKLNDYQRREALKRIGTGDESMRGVAKSYGVDHSMLSRIAKRADLTPKRRKLDDETAKAGRSFLRHLKDRYAPLGAFVYGSRARGTHNAESDADIAVILKGKRGDRQAAAMGMAEIAFDVMQETGVLIDPLPLWESDLKRPELFSNPQLIANIRREGLRL